MSKLQTKPPTVTHVTVTWDEYIQVIEKLEYEKTKGYYHNGQMRLEMPPIGNDHASDHTIIIGAIALFAATKSINLNGKDNCTYRKTGVDEAQPDVSYYIGEIVESLALSTTRRTQLSYCNED